MKLCLRAERTERTRKTASPLPVFCHLWYGRKTAWNKMLVTGFKKKNLDKNGKRLTKQICVFQIYYQNVHEGILKHNTKMNHTLNQK